MAVLRRKNRHGGGRATAIGIALLVLATAAAQERGRLWAADGDSLRRSDGWRGRLLCIDAPELRQAGGAAAHAALRALIADGVELKTRGQDQHGRYLTLVYGRDGKSVNLALVRGGHAWVSRLRVEQCGLSPSALFAAERAARRDKRGLWAAANPQPPWRWRKANNSRQ